MSADENASDVRMMRDDHDASFKLWGVCVKGVGRVLVVLSLCSVFLHAPLP